MPSRPSLWKHSTAVYERLRAEATYTGNAEPYGTADTSGNIGETNGTGLLVWKGFLSTLIIKNPPDGLGLPSPYYSYITNVLKSIDAIKQLKRGGGKTPSEWLVLEFPDRQLFDWKLDAAQLNAKGTRTVTKEKIFQQTIDGLNATMLDLRHRVERLENANGKGETQYGTSS